MRSLQKNIIYTFLTQIPSLLLSIIAGIFITRLLGPEGKGVFSVYTANIEILVLMFSFGTEQGIVYFISNKKIDLFKIQAISVSVLIIASFFNIIILSSINSNVIFVDNYNGIFYKLYLFVMFLFSFSNSIIIAFLKAKKNFKNINLVSILNASLTLLSFSALFILNKYNIVQSSIKLIFIFSIILYSINFIVYQFFFFKTYRFKPNFSLNLKTDILPFYRFSFVGFLGMLVNFLNYRLDIWFVSYFKGAIQLGLYALAVNFAQFVMMISKIISSVMMPYLAENNVEQRKRYFLKYSRINFTIISFVVILLFLTGDFLLSFLYGKEFIGSVVPFRILIFGMIFTGTSQLFSSYFSASGRNDWCLYTNITGLIFTIILDVILIPKFGIIGSAYATFFSYLSIFLVYFGLLLFKEKFNILNLFILKKEDLKI